MELDLSVCQDPVILSHTAPSFTTFGYNSEYALEDILKSGFFEDDSDNIEKEFTKKHCKKRRPKNSFYVDDEKDIKNSGRPRPKIEENSQMFDSSEDSAGEAGEADKFQELYEELQTETGTEEEENVGG